MKNFGRLDEFTTMVRQFHDGMMVKVLDNGRELEPIPVTNGVKQGYVLAPTFFSMVFSATLLDAFQDHEEDGIPIRNRTDGELFKLSRLKALKKKLMRLLLGTSCLQTTALWMQKPRKNATPGKFLLKGMW